VLRFEYSKGKLSQAVSTVWVRATVQVLFKEISTVISEAAGCGLRTVDYKVSGRCGVSGIGGDEKIRQSVCKNRNSKDPDTYHCLALLRLSSGDIYDVLVPTSFNILQTINPIFFRIFLSTEN